MLPLYLSELYQRRITRFPQRADRVRGSPCGTGNRICKSGPMFVTNHVLSGVVIGRYFEQRPVIAFVAGVGFVASLAAFLLGFRPPSAPERNPNLDLSVRVSRGHPHSRGSATHLLALRKPSCITHEAGDDTHPGCSAATPGAKGGAAAATQGRVRLKSPPFGGAPSQNPHSWTDPGKGSYGARRFTSHTSEGATPISSQAVQRSGWSPLIVSPPPVRSHRLAPLDPEKETHGASARRDRAISRYFG